MEVDSLRPMIYNSNAGGDYSGKNAPVSVTEKPDSTKAQPVENKENPQGINTASANQSVTDVNGKKPLHETLKEEKDNATESISNEFFDKFIEEANKKIFASNREFNYSMHEATNRVVIKVLDRTTKEVIREIPPEKKLDAAAKMMELVGIIVDEKI